MMKFSIPSNQLEWREYHYSFQKNEKKLSFDFSIKYEYQSGKGLVKIIRKNLQVNDQNPD